MRSPLSDPSLTHHHFESKQITVAANYSCYLFSDPSNHIDNTNNIQSKLLPQVLSLVSALPGDLFRSGDWVKSISLAFGHWLTELPPSDSTGGCVRVPIT